MTAQDKFAPKEWEALVEAGICMGLAIIISDKPRRSRKELRTMRKAFGQLAGKYPRNELIAQVLPDVEQRANAKFDAKTLYAEKDVLIEAYFAKLAVAGKVLLKAEPKEAREFKQWVLNVGEVTALAVMDEELANIGLPGDEISKVEKKILRRAAKELGLTPYVVDMDPLGNRKT